MTHAGVYFNTITNTKRYLYNKRCYNFRKTYRAPCHEPSTDFFSLPWLTLPRFPLRRPSGSRSLALELLLRDPKMILCDRGNKQFCSSLLVFLNTLCKMNANKPTPSVQLLFPSISHIQSIFSILQGPFELLTGCSPGGAVIFTGSYSFLKKFTELSCFMFF